MLEVSGCRSDTNRLVHHPLADIEVGINPLLQILVLCELLGGKTGPGCVSSLVFSSCLFSLVFVCRCFGCSQEGRKGKSSRSMNGGRAHVKPVLRFMPARMVETGCEVSKLHDAKEGEMAY